MHKQSPRQIRAPDPETESVNGCSDKEIRQSKLALQNNVLKQISENIHYQLVGMYKYH